MKTIYEIKVHNNNFMNHDESYTSEKLEGHFYCKTYEEAVETFKNECRKAISAIKRTSEDCVKLISLKVSSIDDHVVYDSFEVWYNISLPEVRDR